METRFIMGYYTFVVIAVIYAEHSSTRILSSDDQKMIAVNKNHNSVLIYFLF